MRYILGVEINTMRYISLQKYNMEYAGKLVNPRLFYNPDNTVAIFDDEDEDIWQYVKENGEKLKEGNFFMNEENQNVISEYLKANPKETLKVSDEVISGPELSKNKKEIQKLLKELGEKPPAAKVSAALIKLLNILS